MKLSVYNIKEKKHLNVNLSKEIFGIDPNSHFIYLDVKNYLAVKDKEHINQRRRDYRKRKKTKKTKRFWAAELVILKILYLERWKSFWSKEIRNYEFKLNKKVKICSKITFTKISKINIIVLEDFLWNLQVLKDMLKYYLI